MADEIVPFGKEYAWVILVVVLYQILYTLVTIHSSGARKVFTKEFMDQNFKEEHEKAFGAGSKLPGGGYPDTGSGRFSEKLPYKDWYLLNIG